MPPLLPGLARGGAGGGAVGGAAAVYSVFSNERESAAADAASSLIRTPVRQDRIPSVTVRFGADRGPCPAAVAGR